ncbi:ADP-ribosylation factor-related protein 1 [Toxocara canis]|uniref:ADP-ribosylation factor-related protein 1 n=1 Tax=Toxocara canis TaxID=6265 RepID=A0A0B2VDN9_TOXCA|nr:ADP-ribosylation factor-related protein 1 [Toxocara canis]
MYALGQGLWHHLTRKCDFFIVIVGLDNAGKTTFLEQTKMKFTRGYQMLNPLKITSTVGLNIGKIEIGSVRLNFWDLGGQEELHPLWHKYFEDCHALIFVVDACDVSRFSEVASAFKRIMNNEAVQRMPILVVCNKSDVDECASAECIRALTADERHRGDLALVPVSALQGLNIERCIRWLFTALTRNHYGRA